MGRNRATDFDCSTTDARESAPDLWTRQMRLSSVSASPSYPLSQRLGRMEGKDSRGIDDSRKNRWGGSYDHAAVSYACSVGSNPTGTRTLEKPKQWWFAVPAGGKNEFYLITLDHLHDMPARAMSSGRKNTSGGYVSTALEVWKKVSFAISFLLLDIRLCRTHC